VEGGRREVGWIKIKIKMKMKVGEFGKRKAKREKGKSGT